MVAGSLNGRLVPLQGGYNFRHIGGYRGLEGRLTRPGLIYRSGALHQLTAEDLDTLAALNIRAVLDLREDEEKDREGADLLAPGMEYHPRPSTLGREAMIHKLQNDAANFRMVDFYLGSLGPRIQYHAELFQTILKNLDQPLLIHCSAGKDRTGIMVALLLRVAGVAAADILADYAETAQHLGAYHEKQAERFRGYGLPDGAIREMLAAYPETMAATLARIDEGWGSAEGYLMVGGVSAAELAAFREKFLLPPA
jgi:protein-tyrosine phosphatase